MNVGQHRARNDGFAAAKAGLGLPEAKRPASALAPDDDAMLRELERSDCAFIGNLVDDLWGDAGSALAEGRSDDLWIDDEELHQEEDQSPCESAERIAREIVSDWAWDLSDSGASGSSLLACLAHKPHRCFLSFDCDLLVKVLDLDVAARAAWCGPAYFAPYVACGRHGRHRHATEGRVCVAGHLPAAFVMPECDHWSRVIALGLARQREPSPSRLWRMIDGVAKTFRVDDYDPENLLRILLGDFGTRALFDGLADPLLPPTLDVCSRNEPEFLEGIGASLIDYFREWSRAVAAAGRRRPPNRTNDGLQPAQRLKRGWRAVFSAHESLGASESASPVPVPLLAPKEAQMPKLTFFPLGNADTTLIDLAGGQKILFDYANRRNPEDEDDKRCDLLAELRKDLGKRNSYDVVAFTHLDQDHYDGMTEFFHLEHDPDYQGKVDGKDRVKMNTMWVPSAVITEEMKEKESKVVQAEARYRLKKKKGIRVFSLPERLESWLEDNGMELDDVRHLITDAGRTIPGYNLDDHGVEFFVHSPFAMRQDDNEVEIRNDDALVVQATFRVDGVETKLLLFADIDYDVINDIVKMTKRRDNEARLEWHIFKIAHHCSYTAIGPEKGDDKTEPSEEVSWLFRDRGQRGGIIVSTSKAIPKKGTDEDEDVQPPHRQAAEYYREISDEKDGEFVVTMEHPKPSGPKPLVIEIDRFHATVKKSLLVGAPALTSVSAPRAG